ncbi:MAG TPA: hypothetical protein VEB60_03345 [Candidatus Paceibacterota bacterium]|nr:hypothetical protein [Candidatus Paceibacterota bacterium]
MSHYVCDGSCRGTSEYVGYCQAAGCSHQGQELKTCDCLDEHHQEVLGGAVDEDNKTGEMADDFAG